MSARQLKRARRAVRIAGQVELQPCTDLRPAITEPGQPFVDDPVFRTAPVYCGVGPELATHVAHYQRVKLNWKSPVFDESGAVIGLAKKEAQ